MTTKPKLILYVFSISHYCEKAKWALDYLGFDYQVKVLLPGLHMVFAKKLGLNGSSLPFLQIDDLAIQGSSEIIDWAEKNSSISNTTLALATTSTKPEELEKRLDDVLGVHLRRYFYSEALVDYPETVKPIFAEGLTFIEKIKLSMMWPTVCKKMIARMNLGEEQRVESQKLIESELDYLDKLLSDGRSYLFEDKFSRVDLTASSLLGIIVSSPEHPAQDNFVLPPMASKLAKEWSNRPTFKWVLNMYAKHRR